MSKSAKIILIFNALYANCLILTILPTNRQFLPLTIFTMRILFIRDRF